MWFSFSMFINSHRSIILEKPEYKKAALNYKISSLSHDRMHITPNEVGFTSNTTWNYKITVWVLLFPAQWAQFRARPTEVLAGWTNKSDDQASQSLKFAQQGFHIQIGAIPIITCTCGQPCEQTSCLISWAWSFTTIACLERPWCHTFGADPLHIYQSFLYWKWQPELAVQYSFTLLCPISNILSGPFVINQFKIPQKRYRSSSRDLVKNHGIRKCQDADLGFFCY